MRFNNSILRSCFFIDIQPISDNKMKNIKFKTVFICKVNSFLFACDYKNKKIQLWTIFKIISNCNDI